MSFDERDIQFIRRALELAQIASAQGEVPIGAILVQEKHILGEGWNSPISKNDPSAHAEIQALREAADRVKNYRLPGTTMYVTLEPCLMCMGAMVLARVDRIVFGAYDIRIGLLDKMHLLKLPGFNHHISCEGGLLGSDCQELLTSFFRSKRVKSHVFPSQVIDQQGDEEKNHRQ